MYNRVTTGDVDHGEWLVIIPGDHDKERNLWSSTKKIEQWIYMKKEKWISMKIVKIRFSNISARV